MKALLGAILATAVLVGTAHSLQCYSCNTTTNIAGCSTTTTCSLDSAYCAKAESTVAGITYVSKSCLPTCTEYSASEGGDTTSVYCCLTDLCNGATSARASYAMLTLAAGACALLLKAGL